MVRAKPALGVGAQLGIGGGRQLELAPYGGRIWRLSQQRIHQRAGRAALGSKHLFGERRDSDIASHDRPEIIWLLVAGVAHDICRAPILKELRW